MLTHTLCFAFTKIDPLLSITTWRVSRLANVESFQQKQRDYHYYPPVLGFLAFTGCLALRGTIAITTTHMLVQARYGTAHHQAIATTTARSSKTNNMSLRRLRRHVGKGKSAPALPIRDKVPMV